MTISLWVFGKHVITVRRLYSAWVIYNVYTERVCVYIQQWTAHCPDKREQWEHSSSGNNHWTNGNWEMNNKGKNTASPKDPYKLTLKLHLKWMLSIQIRNIIIMYPPLCVHCIDISSLNYYSFEDDCSLWPKCVAFFWDKSCFSLALMHILLWWHHSWTARICFEKQMDWIFSLTLLHSYW